MNFRRIKKNYDSQLWDKGMVRTAYKNGVISFIEYYIIVRSVEPEDVPEGMTMEEFVEFLEEQIKDIVV